MYKRSNSLTFGLDHNDSTSVVCRGRGGTARGRDGAGTQTVQLGVQAHALVFFYTEVDPVLHVYDAAGAVLIFHESPRTQLHNKLQAPLREGFPRPLPYWISLSDRILLLISR